MSVTDTPVDNGVNVQALLDAREALTAAPEAAQFKWRASNTWVNGTHSRTTFDGFYGAMQELQHKTATVVESDHPAVLVGADNAPTPVEYLLHGIAACLTSGLANIAAARGVTLNSVTSHVEGDIDLLGILGLGEGQVRNGYRQIKVTFEIDGDADENTLRELLAQSQRRSAVYDVLTNPTNVTVAVA